MESKFKLLALDVDGTLLNDEHEVSSRTERVIKQIHEQGVKVVLATGRGPRSCFHLVDQLELTDPLITHNGAVIYHPGTETITLEIGYKASELLPIIQYCREQKIQFDLSTAFDMYIEGKTPEAEELYNVFQVNPQLVPDSSELKEQIVKLTLTGAPNVMDKALADLQHRFPDWSIIRSGETFIDIIHPQATKGFALQHVLQEYRIDPAEVIAFGNYFNDIEMIRLAGTGVAMENAPDEVKAVADHVTLTNNMEGVAEFLEKYFFIHS